MVDLHGTGREANQSPFRTIHQPPWRKVLKMQFLSRPLTSKQVKFLSGQSIKSGKKEPKSTSFKTNGSKNVHNQGSLKTMQDGSQNDTSFKTIANRVKNLNPWYMVPVDEVSQVISDPQRVKMAPPAPNQPLSGPPPPGSRFNPIYVEPPLTVPGIFKHCSPTALTALETWRASTTSRQTQQSLQSSMEGRKFPSSTRRRLKRS